MSKIPKKPRTSRKALAGAFGGAFGAGTVQQSGIAAAGAEFLTWILFVHVLGVEPGQHSELGDVKAAYQGLQQFLDFGLTVAIGALSGWASGYWKTEDREAWAAMEPRSKEQA